jgi:hypothetical protein
VLGQAGGRRRRQGDGAPAGLGLGRPPGEVPLDLGRPFGGRALHRAGVANDQASLNRGVHDPTEQSVGLGDRVGRRRAAIRPALRAAVSAGVSGK